MRPLIEITRNDSRLVTIVGDWLEPHSWTLRDVQIQFHVPKVAIKVFSPLILAIFRNSYSVTAIGGTTPSSAAYRWETLKAAVRKYCEHYGFQWRLLVKDPEYTDWEAPGEVR